MRPIVHLLSILLLLVCVSTAAFAQGNKKSRDIYQTRDFSISFTNNEVISVSLHAKYVDSTDYYMVSMADSTKFFKLYEPLNYEYFRQELSALLRDRIGGNCISTASTLSVFYWIYTLKRDESEESLKIADLHLGKWVMVSGWEFPKYGRREREEKISMLTEQASEYANALIDYERRLQQLYRNTSAAFAAERDTLVKQADTLEKILNKRYRELSNELAEALKKVTEVSQAQERYIDSARDIAKQLADARQMLKKDTTQPPKADTTKLKSDSIRIHAALDRYQRIITDNPEASKLKDSAALFQAKKERIKILADRQTALSSATLQMDLYKLDSARAVAALDVVCPDSVITWKIARDSIVLIYAEQLRKKSLLTDSRKSLALENIFEVRKISLQFERGFLERIQVWVRNKYGKEDIYENNHAIGISSTANLNFFSEIKLYHRKYRASEYIFLSDALGNYDNMLDISTRDYSPADTAINEIDPFIVPFVTLRKERLVRLFDSRIYTDLVGLDESSPNGLVQVEVSRRFNINTYRKQAGPYLNIGLFNYCNISGGLTKIENKERYLPVRNNKTVINNTLVSPSYVTNLDLRRYENTYLSVDANALLFDAPALKTSLSLDLGVRYGHTSVTDSAWRVNTAGEATAGDSAFRRHAHTVTFELPKITLEFFSERRVGFHLRYQYNITHLFSNNYFKQVMSDVKSDLTQLATEKRARKSHMVEFMLRVETSRNDNGRVFLRARYFLQHGDANNFFPQIQLGYAYNLLFKKD